MDYILQLRKNIGHRPVFVVGAAILLVGGSNRLLMMRRSDNDCWGIPGGSIEPGEIFAYLSRDWRREVKLNEEHTEWRWFTGDEIPEDVSPPIAPVLGQFKQAFLSIEP